MQEMFKKVVSGLDGSNGVVYLMFLGTEKYVSEIQHPLVSSGFYRNKENVNQTFYRLMSQEPKNLFLRFIKEEKAPGKPKIYTASFEPIFITLKQFNIQFNEEKLKKFFTSISFLNDYFPKFLIESHRNRGLPLHQRKMQWSRTLGFYFCFLLLYFEPLLGERLKDEDRKEFIKMRPHFTRGIPYPPKLKQVSDQKMEKFLDEYPGGCDSFVDEIGRLLLSGFVKLMFGPISNRIFSYAESLMRLLTKRNE